MLCKVSLDKVGSKQVVNFWGLCTQTFALDPAGALPFSRPLNPPNLSNNPAGAHVNATSSTLSADRSHFAGLAVDSEHQKLYYTDYEYERIGELSTDGSDHRVLLNVTGSRPRAIVLDPVNRSVCVDFYTVHC